MEIKVNSKTVIRRINDLYLDLKEYIEEYDKGNINSDWCDKITREIVGLYLNGKGFSHSMGRGKNYFYYQKKLGNDYIDLLPYLPINTVDAYYFYIYKIEILNFSPQEFAFFQYNILRMIDFYQKYYSESN